jgi:hypothetical protein
MTTNIPAARALLTEALRKGHSTETVSRLIETALAVMTRRRTKLKTAAKEGRKITVELADQIWETYLRHPDWSILSMANQYDVNPGRVSEIISGRSA